MNLIVLMKVFLMLAGVFVLLMCCDAQVTTVELEGIQNAPSVSGALVVHTTVYWIKVSKALFIRLQVKHKAKPLTVVMSAAN